jgi:hypothetical protein
MICALRQSGPQVHRSGLPLRSVRSPDWLKMKNSDVPAVKREGEWNDDWWSKMTRTELIIQLLKVAIGLAFGAYFVWWSLEVLDRLTPE